MSLGNWNDNKTEPVFWNQVEKIADCDLEAQVCTTTSNYFVTMSFDFKRKLNAAFGVIGKTAYFVQGELFGVCVDMLIGSTSIANAERKLYKVVYSGGCVKNPYTDVVSYDAVDMHTDVTAALDDTDQQGNASLILFDNDMHVIVNVSSMDNIELTSQQLDVCNWQDNSHYLLQQCPLESTLSFLLMDVFSGSKRHYMTKRILLITFAVVLVVMLILVAIIFFKNLSSKSQSSSTPGHLIEEVNNVEIKTIATNGEDKTLLQTSC